MEGTNPFVIWGENPLTIVSRKEEIRTFESFCKKVLSRQLAIMAVSGSIGSGKSFLMSRFIHDAQKQGILCLTISLSTHDSQDSIIKKLLLDLPPRYEDIFSHTAKLTSLSEGISRILANLHKEDFGVIIFVDNLNTHSRANSIVDELIQFERKLNSHHPLGLVFSSLKPLEEEDCINLTLAGFSNSEASELVETALKKSTLKMGHECVSAILEDANSNPRVFKSICWFLYDHMRPNDKIITKGHYLAYQSSIITFLARDWFARLYDEIPASERTILLSLARSPGGKPVSEISRELGRPLGQTTSLIDRLCTRGVILRVSRGKYSIFCNLFGRYVIKMLK
ncbi:DUF2791 family P-loop domain-containing protein [Candidatus Micrarchaeota archaeon]|nr:DUF2791 family P-loop domain-containing protein [Candidatus Micrarchaeota archaeon]